LDHVSDPPDFSKLKPLVKIIEQARIDHGKHLVHFGAYLIGIAVAYMKTGGATDAAIRRALESSLEDS